MTVAIQVCGAASSTPGANTKVKFRFRVVQSMVRRLAMRASMSRPRMLMVMVSPMPTPKPRARAASNETSGGPA